MNAADILVELKQRRVALKIEQNGDIHYEAPRGALAPELRLALIERKAEIKALLQRRVDYAATACVCPVPVGLTGNARCQVCQLPLLCPGCGKCRGCKLRLKFPPGVGRG
jgi:tubulysin polyketide synthase-like protein